MFVLLEKSLYKDFLTLRTSFHILCKCINFPNQGKGLVFPNTILKFICCTLLLNALTVEKGVQVNQVLKMNNAYLGHFRKFREFNKFCNVNFK